MLDTTDGCDTMAVQSNTLEYLKMFKKIIAAVVISVASVSAMAETRVCESASTWSNENDQWEDAGAYRTVFAVSNQIVTMIDAEDGTEISYGFKKLDQEGNRDYHALRGAELTLYKDGTNVFIWNADGGFLITDCSVYE